MIGKVLGNRYEILEQLGGGGMAIVYKGRDTVLNRLVTIKVLRPEYTSDDDFIRRFRREAQAVASLSHPNIVSIYDVGREDGIHYLVMEYVDGEDLKSVIRREGTLAPDRAVQVARQISEALEHAHENNIVHRDVKPHNILLTKSGRPKLTDFGIAREATAATVTHTDTIVGSVHYLSPEQARGEVAGPKSDLYSLGVVLFEMLTGTVPYSGDSAIAVAIKHIQEDPPPPSSINPAIPKGLEQVIIRAMQKNPDHRYASAAEMASHLSEALLDDTGEATMFIPMDDMATKFLKPVGVAGGDAQEEEPGDKIEESKAVAKSKRKMKPAALAVVLSVLGLLLGVGAFAIYNFINVRETKVPDVVNMDLESAQTVLAEYHLKWVIRKEHNNDVLENHVINTDPLPGKEVKRNRSITLTVSLGPDYRTVPDLTGKSLIDAKMTLTEAGFELAEPAQYGYSDNIAEELVFDQEPKAESQAPRGAKVTVYLSKGPQPVEKEVPSLVGLTLDEARAKINELGFQLDEDIDREDSGEYLSGYIIEQDPNAGQKSEEGQKIKLTVSKGPGPLPREATVLVKDIPDDNQSHEVRIVVTDARGTNDAYVATHAAGDQVVKTIKYYGRAKVQVFIDNKLVNEDIL